MRRSIVNKFQREIVDPSEMVKDICNAWRTPNAALERATELDRGFGEPQVVCRARVIPFPQDSEEDWIFGLQSIFRESVSHRMR